MPKEGELTYYDRLGEAGRRHALHKPLSDQECGLHLMRIGGLMALLPPPPGRVLECGCGTGWLTRWLHQRGYDAVGADVAPDAIRLARESVGPEGPRFLVADSENLPFEGEFDAVVFYDSLHHSVNERAALQSAWRALKPDGVCIAIEPGRGHHVHSQEAIETYDVTEKDMPPRYVGRLGKQVGFRDWKCYPAAERLGKTLYAPQSIGRRWIRGLMRFSPLRYLAAFVCMLLTRHTTGITVLRK